MHHVPLGLIIITRLFISLTCVHHATLGLIITTRLFISLTTKRILLGLTRTITTEMTLSGLAEQNACMQFKDKIYYETKLQKD